MSTPDCELKDLLVVVPSRGRPWAATQLADAWITTVGDPDQCQLVVGVDEDDPTLRGYEEAAFLWGNFELAVNRYGYRQAGEVLNHTLLARMHEYRFVGYLNDDNLPRTAGWDRRVVETLADGAPFCFADDLYPRDRGSFACHIFTHTKIVRALGYLALPDVKHMGIDLAWDAWGRATSITFLGDVIIEHCHWTLGQRSEDDTDREAEISHQSDLKAFWRYQGSKRFTEDIAKILGALKASPQTSNPAPAAAPTSAEPATSD